MKVGFIGLGIMGKPMVENLLKANVTVLVNDLNKEAENEVVMQGASAVSVQQMAQQADYVITSLPNGAIVKAVLYSGEDAIVKQTDIKVKAVIDTSSLTPNESLEISKVLETKQIKYMDAPVSGGEPLAITGELSVMIGCAETDLPEVQKVLAPIATSVIRVGDVGAGSVVKLANQIIVNTNIAALSEAVVLAKKFDIDLANMYKAIKGGLAGSSVMDDKFPKMIEEDYRPGGTLNINLKDMKNVSSTADTVGLTLPIANQVKEIYKSEVAHGNGMNDHSGVIKYFENINNM
ncbi:NAD(P)-binding domain-containing protein [Staphylococcus pseudoxylosus]|uniref:NAD(P)-binding domain-containing protein n=1 Tax=Staphylococcus pseudoxylosus TaxID=2282419 RepID=UPI000D1EEBB1|nr:NAD(P)-binding domain-containing protein [Staphylococcus pseudoxylosus]PTI59699.1 2-hydroxy-3-oxopropionate reductase [Staphylococcus xylosus]MDW8797600.1 NAD(P)-binding domain-containing protein [Staphylococcus pseudoxylosus]MEB6036649.1 NAD(P)-binding domain-containing protein [Staphylococcus pseudoxylosus]MEB6062143.1 NAD(P)-binding domain-containing protein [Staphylococcus pseudoxylosus]MEB7753640.1 NAD(P)-binding domain-containing protein [Staphylococcus pseudoxylosus]